MNMRQAQAIKDRMSRELGHEVDLHGHRLWVFPEPSRLAGLESYRGLFGRKVEYLNRLGRAALAGELDTETLRALPRAESLERLPRLAGPGDLGAPTRARPARGTADDQTTRATRALGADSAGGGAHVD